MKTYFEDPTLKVILFKLKDVLSDSIEVSTDEDELPPMPFNP